MRSTNVSMPGKPCSVFALTSPVSPAGVQCKPQEIRSRNVVYLRPQPVFIRSYGSAWPLSAGRRVNIAKSPFIRFPVIWPFGCMHTCSASRPFGYKLRGSPVNPSERLRRKYRPRESCKPGGISASVQENSFIRQVDPFLDTTVWNINSWWRRAIESPFNPPQRKTAKICYSVSEQRNTRSSYVREVWGFSDSRAPLVGLKYSLVGTFTILEVLVITESHFHAIF